MVALIILIDNVHAGGPGQGDILMWDSLSH